MAIPAAIGAAAIGVGGNLIGQAAGAFASRRANKRMVDFWNMQNAYNHPKEQMKRLQEAGLNPNLIYGESTTGATGQAGDIGRPDKPDFRNPLSEITAYQDVGMKSIQQDLLTQQRNAEFQRTILLAEQQGLIGIQQRKTTQDYNQAAELFKSSLQASRLNVENMKQEILGKQLDNDFKSQTLKDAISKLYFESQNAQNIFKGRQLQNRLLELQTQFLNLGLDRNSPWYAKIFGNLINKANE